MKTVFVTGANRGLGLAVCRSLRAAGYHAAALTRDEGFDVTNHESIRRSLAPYASDGSVWGVVHCAGVGRMGLTMAMHQSWLASIVETNLLGTIYVNKLVGQILARRKQGRIVNMSSIAATMAIRGEAAYSASKAGVETFSRAFAREMSVFNVTVNCVAPGPVKTDMTAHIPSDVLGDVVRQQALRRMATPDEVARIAVLLMSEEASMITGDVIHVGGA